MRKSTFAIFVCFAAFLLSCGAKKNAESVETKVFSKVDYAYIEKFHEGVRLKSKGQVKDAIKSFEACLAMRQDDDAVYYALSELYLMDNNALKSGESIKKAAKLDPNNLHYINELAFYYIDKEQFPEAITAFEKLVKAQPSNPEVLYPYAECLVRAGKTQEAINVFNRTQDQVGLIPDMSVRKYNLYMQLKQSEKAYKELELARKVHPQDPQLLSTLVEHYFNTNEPKKAINTLVDLSNSDPSNGRVHFFLADIYLQNGDIDLYYASLKRGFLGEGLDLDMKMTTLVNLQKQQGVLDNRALELAEIFVSQYPEDARPYSVLGDYLYFLGKEKEALDAYKMALNYQKNTFALWSQVLTMQYQQKRFDELVIDSKEGIKYFPTMPVVYLLNGVANNQLKNFDTAIESLEIGGEFVVNDPVLLAGFYGQLGEAYFQKKDAAKGQSFYNKALEKDPKSTLLMNNYAYRLATAKVDLKKAETLMKSAIRNSPNQAQFLDTYGWVFFQKEDYNEALSYFQKAYELNKEDPTVLEHLGDAFSKLKKNEEAVNFWKLAKSFGSKSEVLDLKIEKKTYYEALP